MKKEDIDKLLLDGPEVVANVDDLMVPRGNYLVRTLPESRQPKLSRIVYTGNNDLTPMFHLVVKAGPGNFDPKGNMIEPMAREGDMIITTVNAGIELKTFGEGMRWLPEMNILLVVPPKGIEELEVSEEKK